MDNVGLKRGALELLEYNPEYCRIFIEEKKNLEQLFYGKYINIEHVGSTSIKDIKSKPIIDILLTCKDLDDFIKYTKKYVESETYTIKEQNTDEGDFLIRKEENGKVKAFIHVLPESNIYVENYLLFRYYLNNNPDEAKRYENLKLDLIKKYPNDRQSYTAGKAEYIKSIILKAKK